MRSALLFYREQAVLTNTARTVPIRSPTGSEYMYHQKASGTGAPPLLYPAAARRAARDADFAGGGEEKKQLAASLATADGELPAPPQEVEIHYHREDVRRLDGINLKLRAKVLHLEDEAVAHRRTIAAEKEGRRKAEEELLAHTKLDWERKHHNLAIELKMISQRNDRLKVAVATTSYSLKHATATAQKAAALARIRMRTLFRPAPETRLRSALQQMHRVALARLHDDKRSRIVDLRASVALCGAALSWAPRIEARLRQRRGFDRWIRARDFAKVVERRKAVAARQRRIRQRAGMFIAASVMRRADSRRKHKRFLAWRMNTTITEITYGPSIEWFAGGDTDDPGSSGSKKGGAAAVIKMNPLQEAAQARRARGKVAAMAAASRATKAKSGEAKRRSVSPSAGGGKGGNRRAGGGGGAAEGRGTKTRSPSTTTSPQMTRREMDTASRAMVELLTRLDKIATHMSQRTIARAFHMWRLGCHITHAISDGVAPSIANDEGGSGGGKGSDLPSASAAAPLLNLLDVISGQHGFVRRVRLRRAMRRLADLSVAAPAHPEQPSLEGVAVVKEDEKEGTELGQHPHVHIATKLTRLLSIFFHQWKMIVPLSHAPFFCFSQIATHMSIELRLFFQV